LPQLDANRLRLILVTDVERVVRQPGWEELAMTSGANVTPAPGCTTHELLRARAYNEHNLSIRYV